MPDVKPWYQSRAMLAGYLLTAAGLLKLVADYLSTGAVDFEALLALLNGLGIVGLRGATKPVV